LRNLSFVQADTHRMSNPWHCIRVGFGAYRLARFGSPVDLFWHEGGGYVPSMLFVRLNGRSIAVFGAAAC
jgi:hypothetical protein